MKTKPVIVQTAAIVLRASILIVAAAVAGCAARGAEVAEPANDSTPQTVERADTVDLANLAFVLDGLVSGSSKDVVSLLAGVIAGLALETQGTTRIAFGNIEWDARAGRLHLSPRDGRPGLRLENTLEDDQKRVLTVQEVTLQAEDERTLLVQWTCESDPSAKAAPLISGGEFRGKALISLDDRIVDFEIDGPNLKMQGRLRPAPVNSQIHGSVWFLLDPAKAGQEEAP